MIWNGINVGDIITNILVVLLPLVFLALAGYAVKLAHAAYTLFQQRVWSQLSAQQQATVESVAKVAVTMAEQIAKRDDVQNAAKAKRDMAFNYIDQTLQKYGIKLSAAEIYAMIESAVHTEINQFEIQPDPTPGQPGSGSGGTAIGGK